ncbi:MAG TPA: nucleoside hydrolase-like domain-containing protein, partial [Tepidisphaeraceae bacterium]|nr:nucleoside hydrolase-like domain-containing protein [Tepidisphaeraceae bacterium]
MKLASVILALLALAGLAMAADRVRLIVETDAGGDPDDEQSMVRFLLYSNDFDVEGIIANRPKAREGENRNSERTGLGIVRRMVKAYGKSWSNLSANDRRYPTEENLQSRTVAGYDEVEDGVKLVMDAVDRDDPRPVWFCNWGTDKESGVSCLKRTLDRVRNERGEAGYAKFKNKIRLSSADKFGEHTNQIEPPFVIWVDTFRPEVDRKRWYHRFSGITATAGGFDVKRDVLNNHGPLGELYPLNTTHPQKEGDTMTFL